MKCALVVLTEEALSQEAIIGESESLAKRLHLNVSLLGFGVHCWACRHSQGLEDKNLGSSPSQLGQ